MKFRDIVLKMLRSLIVAVLSLAIAAPGAMANLIINPSFENSYQDWSYSNVDWWTGWTAKDGGVSIDLSGGSAGWISQSFATTNGDQYEVTFWLAGNPVGDPVVKKMEVFAGNVSGLQYTFDTTGHSISDMGWTEKSFFFTATGTSTILKFASLDETFYGPAIDLVSVDLAPAPIPAPFWLFGSGLLGLVAWRRRS